MTVLVSDLTQNQLKPGPVQFPRTRETHSQMKMRVEELEARRAALPEPVKHTVPMNRRELRSLIRFRKPPTFSWTDVSVENLMRVRGREAMRRLRRGQEVTAYPA